MDGWGVIGMVVMLGWIVPIGLSYRTAVDRGYQPIVGLVLGFFLGWFGVLICHLLTDRLQGDTLRRCPYCAEQIRSAATVCRYCQRDVESMPAR